MNIKSNTFVKFLTLGYVFIFGLVVFSAYIFFNYEERLSLSLQKYAKNITFQKSADELLDASSQRSILLVRMMSTKDIFEIDSLRMKMYQHGLVVDKSLINLKETSLKEDLLSLKSVRKFMLANRDAQNMVYDLVMDDNVIRAQKELINTALPKQRKVHSILYSLSKSYNQKSQDSFVQYSALVSEMKMMILMASLPINFSLIVVAFLSIKRLQKYGLEQQALLDNLENLVQSRSQELFLDKQLMQNLSEAIGVFGGVFGSDEKIVIYNKKMFKLIPNNINIDKLTIWKLLEYIFEDISIERIQHQLFHQKKWRGEARLLSSLETFVIVNIALVEDESLPDNYYSIVLTDVSELKEIQKKLEVTANFDEITQLPNRRSFNYQIAKQIEKNPNETFHLLYLDLDNFKWVNDHYGHEVGDQFLYDFGKKIQSILKGEHAVYRLGGDEFIILIKVHYSETKLLNLAESLIAAIKETMIKGSHKQEVGCSIGVATYPIHAHEVGKLLNCADFAMYHAKKEGMNRYRLFDDEMNNELRYLHQIEENLKLAVTNQEFEVYYQPQYQLKNLNLIGAEALLRWPQGKNADVTEIMPSEFIPLAEKYGLINELGEFVFKQAVSQLMIWMKLDAPLPRVAINVSSTQLLSGEFGEFVDGVLKKNELLPSMIDIEVTESVMMNNLDQNDSLNTNYLKNLQRKGLEISIDDFGTGYSSLAYIKHLEVDRIKIDKSFVDDIVESSEARSIVKSIIDIGHSLGLKVLAEGIETTSQLETLQMLECDEGQGYLFSRPIPAKEFQVKCLS